MCFSQKQLEMDSVTNIMPSWHKKYYKKYNTITLAKMQCLMPSTHHMLIYGHYSYKKRFFKEIIWEFKNCLRIKLTYKLSYKLPIIYHKNNLIFCLDNSFVNSAPCSHVLWNICVCNGLYRLYISLKHETSTQLRKPVPISLCCCQKKQTSMWWSK